VDFNPERDKEFLSKLIEAYAVFYHDHPGSLIFVSLADVYFKLGNYGHALEICQDGLNLHPDYSTAWALMGQIYFKSGNREAAERVCRRAVRKNPENLKAQGILYRIYWDKKDYRKAIDPLEVLARNYPEEGEYRDRLEKIRAELTNPVPTPLRADLEDPEPTPLATDVAETTSETPPPGDGRREIFPPDPVPERELSPGLNPFKEAAFPGESDNLRWAEPAEEVESETGEKDPPLTEGDLFLSDKAVHGDRQSVRSLISLLRRMEVRRHP
jgi:tetratricopeptide (TPR) repeat protein